MARNYVALSITPEARDALRNVVYTTTGALGRKVEISETIIALSTLGRANLEKLTQLLGED